MNEVFRTIIVPASLALLCLALMGCASHNMRDTYAHGDLDCDGCIAYRCKVYCRDDATKEQVKAFSAGTIDDGERAQLKRLAIWTTGDTVTTVGALALCEAAREANPILGPNPSPLAVIAYNGAAYAYAYQSAKRTPAWCSSERPLKTMANIRMAASISNAAVLAVCQ